MNTRALAAFTEIADSGSFTQAALALHLSQPAISKRITTLEQQIGQSLFGRIGRRVRLTDAGRALLPYARKALQDIEDGRRALSQLHDQIGRSEEHTSELQSLMRSAYAVFCLKKKKKQTKR